MANPHVNDRRWAVDGGRYPDSVARQARRPVGVFDSGVGGLSVLRYVRELLPAEEVVYAADEAWCPYGPRPRAVIRQRAEAMTRALAARGAKAVVVACNTASTAALAFLRGRFPDLPIVGMEPAVKPAAAQTRSGTIGVLATATTARGEALARLVDRFGRGVAVHVAVPEGLVELVERGEGDSPAAEALLRPILARWAAAQVDAIVLGCTHYPFARAAIQRLAGRDVVVIDPAPAVARQVLRVLEASGVLAPPGRPGAMTFLTTGDAARLRQTVERLMPQGWAAGAAFEALS